MDTTHGTRRVRSIAILAAIVAMPASAAPAKAERRRRRRSAVFGWPRTTSTWARTSSRCSGSRGPSWRRRPPRRGRTCRRPTSGSAKAIARAIAEEHPHLVGLQEVSFWQTAPLTNPAALTTRYDFQLLLDELAARDAPYEAAAVNTHFSAFLPVSGTEGVRWTQRNAVIARTDLEDETFVVTNARKARSPPRCPSRSAGRRPRSRGDGRPSTSSSGGNGRGSRPPTSRRSASCCGSSRHRNWSILATSPYDVVLAGLSQLAPRLRGRLLAHPERRGIRRRLERDDAGAPGYTATFGDDLVGPPTELDHTVDYVMRSSEERSMASTATVGDGRGDRRPDRGRSLALDHAGVTVTVRIVKG